MVISIDVAIKTEAETSFSVVIKELTLGPGYQSMDMKPQIFCSNVFSSGKFVWIKYWVQIKCTFLIKATHMLVL